MRKTLDLQQADNLATTDDRIWWETYGKTLVSFRPGRGGNTVWRKDGYFNRNWSRGRGNWGTIRRIEVSDDGLFRL